MLQLILENLHQHSGNGLALSCLQKINVSYGYRQGFAHGFVVLSETAEFLYKTTDYYAPEYERCIRWDDADLAIDWQFDEQPLVSEKDAQGRAFKEADIVRMKILLFGKNGQVGWELNRSLQPLGEIIALDREDADFSNPESLRANCARY